MKVGKNNFRPPPEVESSIVHIEPKTGIERPGVSWEEWDGMLRICFVRKNRTLRASWLGSKKVLALCEKNFKVWCALNNVPIHGGEDKAEDIDDAQDQDIDITGSIQVFPKEEEWDSTCVDMVEDDPTETKSKSKTTKIAQLVREKIRKVLRGCDRAGG